MQTPRPEVSAAIETIRTYGHEVKSRLFSAPQGLLKRPFLQAGIKAYPVLVDWDAIWSGFFYLEEGDPQPLRDSLLNLIDHIAPDGKGQRRIDIDTYSAMPYQIRPFLVSGAWVLSGQIGTDWLSDPAMDALSHYLTYWHQHRQGRHGLLTWLHVDEGFADNGLQNWAWESGAVEAVDLNSQLVREHLALAGLLEGKGRSADAEASRFRAAQLAERIERYLWNAEFGGYTSLYNPPRRFDPSASIQVHGYSNLWPLWVGFAEKTRAKQVIENLLLSEDHLMSPIGIRSLSKQERCFNNMWHGISNPLPGSPLMGPVYQSNCSNWQGPLWVIPNLMALDILVHYGYPDEARALADRLLCFYANALNTHRCFHENYHSETGDPLCAPGIVSWNLCLAHTHRHLSAPRFQSLSLST